MFQNIVIGKPLIEPWKLISSSEREFEDFDKRETLFTNERFLPTILVESGIVKSTSEVRRNKPQLCIELKDVDCVWVKWGKQKVFIIVGK